MGHDGATRRSSTLRECVEDTVASFERVAENYVYRGLLATIMVAKAFGEKPLIEALYEFLAKYESANGHTKEV
jgi:hypothetical protein